MLTEEHSLSVLVSLFADYSPDALGSGASAGKSLVASLSLFVLLVARHEFNLTGDTSTVFVV